MLYLTKYDRAIQSALFNYRLLKLPANSDKRLYNLCGFDDDADVRLIVEAVQEKEMRETGTTLDYAKEVERAIANRVKDRTRCPVCDRDL